MMMFKIISKKRYEALIEENAKLSAVIESVDQIKSVNNGHVCDGLCKGCKHLIKSEEGYYIGYGVYYDAYDCDLNRACNDYEEEGPEVQWKGAGVSNGEKVKAVSFLWGRSNGKI